MNYLNSENSQSQILTYTHDSVYNRTENNRKIVTINGLNELLAFDATYYSYDLNGNLTFKKTPSETSRFTYDPLDRLIEVVSTTQTINFVYDPLGRRISKTIHTPTLFNSKSSTCEHYLYHDQNEIGAFVTPSQPKNLRILGLGIQKQSPATIAIELDTEIFAPLLDVQGNIRRLIDVKNKKIAESYDFTAFGQELQTSSTPPF